MSSSSSRKHFSDLVSTGLSIPDINIWLALAAPEHPHHTLAKRWWKQHEGPIGFARLSQLGLLRLTTTAAAMDGKPLTIDEAWRVYDGFYEDDRVTFIAEPAEVEKEFRERAAGRASSPKIWGDAWMLAMAEAAGGVLVTFDKALSLRGAHCLLSKSG
jgi:toxin-antitoxin system PIN domain toxin